MFSINNNYQRVAQQDEGDEQDANGPVDGPLGLPARGDKALAGAKWRHDVL